MIECDIATAKYLADHITGKTISHCEYGDDYFVIHFTDECELSIPYEKVYNWKSRADDDNN